MCLSASLSPRHSLGNTDGTRRADKTAEVTADALGSYQTGVTGLAIKDDGLMPAIAARHFATSATDTQFLVELRIDNGLAIQVVGLLELRQQFAHQVL